MKHPCTHRNVSKHSLAAFVATVALAVVASVTQLLPDITAQSVDALTNLPDGVDRALTAAALE